MYLSILDKKSKGILNKLIFLENYGFYLAGGTALALYLGHRISVDFDFYTKREFDALRGLIYFKDADDDIGEIRLLKNVEWSKVKAYILKEANKAKELL